MHYECSNRINVIMYTSVVFACDYISWKWVLLIESLVRQTNLKEGKIMDHVISHKWDWISLTRKQYHITQYKTCLYDHTDHS